jgi:FlaA1/EpsC-like NDP-sugar epimerase
VGKYDNVREASNIVIGNLTPGVKLILGMLVDAFTAFVALLFSGWFLNLIFQKETAEALWWLPVAASAITVSSFYFMGLYRTILRFAGPKFFIQVGISSFIVAGLVASVALAYIYGESLGFPRRVFLLFAITLAIGSASTRLAVRWYIERDSKKHRIKTIIYGAGDGGHQLYFALRHGGQYSVVAFVDDDPLQQRRKIHEVDVFSPKKLGTLIGDKKAEVILLAMPGISQPIRAEIVSQLQQFDVVVKTTPKLSELISGKSSLSDIHDLSVADLMNRSSVEANEELAGKCVVGKSVLVTGAGGSIGSELCRQIINRRPATVVLYEMTESALFYVEQELLNIVDKTESKITIIPVLGSVLDGTRLKETMLRHKVASVFHAAAYKHVPMVEANPIEGVRNNVLGTMRVLQACDWADVQSLVVVSTDKAVRPTNLMGATKRFAELIVQALGENTPNMDVCMVRFGNVLGSSGSVIPTFQEQIKRGGPVTVTHREMTRYFMTIPEASQLVLQAGAMADKSEVFVLDMGEPKLIYDLARDLIELSGHRILDPEHPNGDIEIIFTGLRPGEKMHEELSINGCLEQTNHPKIHRSLEGDCDPKAVMLLVEQLEKAIEDYDENEVVRIVCLAVREYVPSSAMLLHNPSVSVNANEQVSTTI